MAFSCAVEPLRIANLESGTELYRWSFLSEEGTQATCSNGSVTLVHGGLDKVPKCDQLFVLTGINMRNHVTGPLLGCLRRQKAMGTPVGALCSGAWILAEAGFLSGQRAAIHWEFHDAFEDAFPDVTLVRNVFVADEKHVTASGGTATADLMLHLIEAAHGADLAAAIADQMVYTGVREGSAEQRASLQSPRGMRNAHLARAIKMMHEHLDDPMSPALIAETIGISGRQLERLFGKHLGTSPKKYYMEMRLDRARHLLVQTEGSVSDVAYACGFESPGHFSRVYKTAFGITPMQQRDKLG
ncbi:MAG: GlxA family transcriptional regulator [Pseudomonadota bacterium]